MFCLSKVVMMLLNTQSSVERESKVRKGKEGHQEEERSTGEKDTYLFKEE